MHSSLEYVSILEKKKGDMSKRKIYQTATGYVHTKAKNQNNQSVQTQNKLKQFKLIPQNCQTPKKNKQYVYMNQKNVQKQRKNRKKKTNQLTTL